MTYQRVSWARVESCVAALARAIRAARFRPDCIVTLLRGGMVPARLLADALAVSDLYAVRARAYEGTRPLGRVAIEPIRVPLAGRRVLLVDDIVDSGATLREAVRRLRRRRPAALAMATLYRKLGAGAPEFSAAAVPAGVWVVFPWERRECRIRRHAMRRRAV